MFKNYSALIMASVILTVGSNIVLGASGKEENVGEGSGFLPEIIIKGEGRTGVETKKPKLKFTFDPNEPVKPLLKTDEDILKRLPESVNIIRARSPRLLASKYIYPPRYKNLAGDPVAVFYPLREVLKIIRKKDISRGWELVIVDARGQSFKRFLGEELPPSSVSWDGRGDNGSMVDVGQPYNFIVTYRDTKGKIRTAPGSAFSFDGLIFRLDTSVIISVSANKMFNKRGNTEVVSARGEELLEEAVEFIQRYYPQSPLRVEATSREMVRAQTWGTATLAHLEKALMMPSGRIAVRSKKEFTPVEKVDIIIHAR